MGCMVYNEREVDGVEVCVIDCFTLKMRTVWATCGDSRRYQVHSSLSLTLYFSYTLLLY